jgi:hypothetical protein
MSGLQPFDPDNPYCVHCHAEAAGMCARCGALCCGDCVELRLGLTRHQAVCRLCLAAEGEVRRRPGRIVIGTLLAILAMVIAWRWLAA